MDLGATKKKRKEGNKKSSFNEDKHEEIKGKKDTCEEWMDTQVNHFISYNKNWGMGEDERK